MLVRNSRSAGIAIPAPASAFGFNTLAFYDGFADRSTIDTTNSKANGFKWYTDRSWPNATRTPTPSSDITAVSNGVKLIGAISDNYCMGTTVWLGGSGFQGFTIDGSAGAYVEATMSINKSDLATGGIAWPSFWGSCVHMIPAPNPFIEDDFLEAFPTGSGTCEMDSNFHRWNTGVDTHISNYNWGSQADFTSNVLFKIARLIVPMSKNAGTGLRQVWFNDVQKSVANVSYTSGDPYALADSETFSILLSGPAIYRSIAVWTP